MRFTCDNCDKIEDAQSLDTGTADSFEGRPAGWLVRQDWCHSELMGEVTVCSERCACEFTDKERARKEEERTEYERRRAAGDLTPLELTAEMWDAVLAEQYAQMRAMRATFEGLTCDRAVLEAKPIAINTIKGLDKL